MTDPAARRIWDAALGQLQLHVTRPNYETWLKDTVGLHLEDGLLVVGAPTAFVREWLATRMRSLVSQTVSSVIGRPTEVTFDIVSANGANGSRSVRTAPLSATPGHAVAASPVPQANLNPRYTFATFVVGTSNRLAAASATAVAEKPGSAYNPLFIYSAPGLGKTHLLQAITQYARQTNRHCLYITAEQFTNDFVTSLARGCSDHFRHRYRTLQLLLVDDIQFLAGKERTQDEFFYTFNDLHASGCQLVLANDRPPAAIQGIEGRLRSRLQWGLVADIQPPGIETRVAIIQAKAQQLQIHLPPDIVSFLASRVPENVRDLEGSLNRVVAYARLLNAPAITLDLARHALTALSPATIAPAAPHAILSVIAAHFHIPIQALTGPSRARPITEARHIAMFLLRHDAQLALKQIGLHLGNRDHATVIHGIRKITSALATDPALVHLLTELRAQLSR